MEAEQVGHRRHADGPDAIIAASESVVADEFYQRQYGVMFETMVELFNEGQPVELW